MGTHSRIGVMHGDKVKSIYCHWDGYLEHNGQVLEQYYDSAKANQLVALGDMSTLRPQIGEKHAFSQFDLPPEEDNELCIPAQIQGLNFIRLATPTTDEKRLPRVLKNTSGFVYYVSITGITGAAEADVAYVAPEVAKIKSATKLPIIVGFGINTPEKSQAIASVADGVVVGSAIVSKIADGESVDEVLNFVKSLADGAHNA